MNKAQRQALIKQIITEQHVETQEELSALLAQAGVATTQATISRDIRELNIIKSRNQENKTTYTLLNKPLYQRSTLTDEEKLAQTITEVVIKLTQVEFMNILTTVPGNAQSLAALIDKVTLPEIVGTVAGDDTVLLISKNIEIATDVHHYFDQFFFNE